MLILTNLETHSALCATLRRHSPRGDPKFFAKQKMLGTRRRESSVGLREEGVVDANLNSHTAFALLSEVILFVKSYLLWY